MGELKIAYSDKKVTPWGGMKLLKDFIDHLQILPYLVTPEEHYKYLN